MWTNCNSKPEAKVPTEAAKNPNSRKTAFLMAKSEKRYCRNSSQVSSIRSPRSRNSKDWPFVVIWVLGTLSSDSGCSMSVSGRSARVANEPITASVKPRRTGIQGSFSMSADPIRGARSSLAVATAAILAKMVVLETVNLRMHISRPVLTYLSSSAYTSANIARTMVAATASPPPTSLKIDASQTARNGKWSDCHAWICQSDHDNTNLNSRIEKHSLKKSLTASHKMIPAIERNRTFLRPIRSPVVDVSSVRLIS